MVIFLGEFTRANSNAGYLLAKYGWGRMWSTRVTLNPEELVEGEPIGFDNGAYLAWDKESPLEWRDFPESKFLRRLERLPRTPHVAVAPDLPMGGRSSLEFSLWWLGSLPESFPWYLAVQDGMDEDDVASNLGNFTGLFLGGSDAIKKDAFRWCQLAKAHGKKFHYGRASTYRRVRDARLIGADSIDSSVPVTALGFGRPIVKWKREALNLNPQKELFS